MDKATLLMILRYSLVITGATGVVGEFLSDSVKVEALVNLAFIVGPPIWAWFDKRFEKKVLQTALATGGDLTETEVREMVKDGDALKPPPPFTALIVIVLLSGGLAGCAATGAVLVKAEATAFVAVKTAKLSTDKLCDSHLVAPAQCRAIYLDLLPLSDATISLEQALQKNSTTALPDMFEAIVRLGRGIEAAFPDDAERKQLLELINSTRQLLKGMLGPVRR